MTSIHYFPRYSQRENFVTNNSLLLLYRLHEYNRLKFEKLLRSICAQDDIDPPDIGLRFRQQVGTGASVLDGYIHQQDLRLAIETKLGTTFNMGQLNRHLNIFEEGRPQQFLLLLSKSDAPLSDEMKASLQAKLPKGVQVLQTSFDSLIAKFRDCLSEFEEEMLALIADFESFCSSAGLLSTDKHTMFVPPCARSLDGNLQFKLYYCPASWSRRKVKYLGIYANKRVQAIGEIKKIVSCNLSVADRRVDVLEGGPLTAEEIERILGAAQWTWEHNRWNLSTDARFFLCDEMVPTNFKKTSSGGIMGHRYINLRKVFNSTVPSSLAEVASRLTNLSWE